MKRKLSLLFVLLLIAALVTACSAQKKAESPATSAPGAAPMPAESKAPPMMDRDTGNVAAPTAPIAPTAPSGGSAPVNLPSDRKIILNASFEVKVKDSDDTINKISAAVRAAGGYVQDNRQQGTKVQGRRVNMTVRVPTGQYGAVTDLVRAMGEVVDQREWTEDVTAQFVDLEERIKTKEIHLGQLQKLYAQGGTIKEMMELEAEINRVTSDLESMKGQMRVLASRVDFSTIIINLYEPGAPAPIQAPKTLWERMQRGFTESWNGVVNFLGNGVVFVVSSVPVLVLLGIFSLLALLVVRFTNKRFRRPQAPPPQDPPGPPSEQ